MMSTSIDGSNSQSTISAVFPVRWPLTHENVGNRRQKTANRATNPQIKRRKIEFRNIAEHNENPDDDHQENARQLYRENSCSQGTANDEVAKCERSSKRTVPNIFNCLDHEETSWLAKEVNEANKSICVVEVAAKRFKQDGEILDQTKSSLCSLMYVIKFVID